MDPLIIPIRDRRAKLAERMDLLGHGSAVVGLLAAAMGGLPGDTPAQTALGAIELVAAAALVGAIVREVRGREAEDQEPARISWLKLAAAAVLFVEWYASWSAGGKLFSPSLLSGAVTFGLAFLHPLIQRRRHEKWSLRIDDDGIVLRSGRFRRAEARWSELRAVDATRDAVRLVTADGREQRISLRMATNRDDVAAAVREAAGRMLRIGAGSG
jgi:selenocysteine lyase/cysteine desulfurase